MSRQIQAVRGMNDLLPDAVAAWQRVEAEAARVFAAYGYREIRVPLLERTELFARSIGEVTDIVEREMYTFEDRNGDSLTLRPEGTAGCVRAGIENGLLHNQVQRLWYAGPMFRYERPQRGRYRQFHQLGVEVFGLQGPDLDAELIALGARLWNALGLGDLKLEINSLGTAESRKMYRAELVRFLEGHRAALDDDSLRRLETNPLRILDSKNPQMQDVIAGAPRLSEHLDEGSREHFEGLRRCLDAVGIEYVVNERLVRGLDYYTRTVFEWTTNRLGAQGTVCGGGRYDGLVEQLGGRPTPAAGFGLGMERLVELVDVGNAALGVSVPDAYVAVIGEGLQPEGMVLSEELRSAGVHTVLHCGGGSLKSQMKRADRTGALFAVIIGEAELEQGTVTVKPLRDDRPQRSMARDAVAGFLIEETTARELNRER